MAQQFIVEFQTKNTSFRLMLVRPDPRCTASASDQNVLENVTVFGPMTDVGVSKKGRRRGSLDINQMYAPVLDSCCSLCKWAVFPLLTGSEKGKHSHEAVNPYERARHGDGKCINYMYAKSESERK